MVTFDSKYQIYKCHIAHFCVVSTVTYICNVLIRIRSRTHSQWCNSIANTKIYKRYVTYSCVTSGNFWDTNTWNSHFYIKIVVEVYKARAICLKAFVNKRNFVNIWCKLWGNGNCTARAVQVEADLSWILLCPRVYRKNLNEISWYLVIWHVLVTYHISEIKAFSRCLSLKRVHRGHNNIPNSAATLQTKIYKCNLKHFW